MPDRLDIVKTNKLYINGQFPRSESGRSLVVKDVVGEVTAHACLASRKDLRDAVVAARAAHDGWLKRSAYNRGQILYRMAEMMEGKRGEFESLIAAGIEAARAASKKKVKGAAAAGELAGIEVTASIDRLIAFAGWADKFSQVLGCHNTVNGPYYNFTVAEGTGVVAIVAPDQPSLLGLVSLLAPAVCSGSTVVALGSESAPLATCVLGEVCGTSDVPAGVINILTGKRDELVPHFSSHREIDAIHAAGVSAEQAKALREGAAGNVKRVTVLGGPVETGPGRTRKGVAANANRVDWFDDDQLHSPWMIEPMVEMKTIWHPSGA